jgi:hypothetical protein
MEILSFGIDCAPKDKTPQVTRRQSINLQPPTSLSAIVNTFPPSRTARQAAPKSVHDQMESCSRCRGIRVHDPVEILFTIAWNTHM